MILNKVESISVDGTKIAVSWTIPATDLRHETVILEHCDGLSVFTYDSRYRMSPIKSYNKHNTLILWGPLKIKWEVVDVYESYESDSRYVARRLLAQVHLIQET